MKLNSTVLAFAILFSIALVFSFSTDKILDPDSLYHIRHADIYKTGGLFQTDFPWTQFSVIKTHTSDIWYGFHLLLIPFTLFTNLFVGIKLSAAILTAVTLFLIYSVLKRHNISYTLFWVIFLYFSAADFLFRINMARPQTISLGLLALLLSLFIKSRKVWPIFLVSFLISFLHLAFFWAALLIGFIVVGIKLALEKTLERDKFLPLFGGLILGWLLRPNPFGALKILKVQLFELLLEKQKSVPLLFGEDILPLDWAAIKFQLIPAILLLALSLGIFLWVWKSGRLKTEVKSTQVFLWSLLALMSIFAVLAFQIGRRASDFAVVYLILFLAQLMTRQISFNRIIGAGIVIIFIFAVFRHSYTFDLYTKASNVVGPNDLKEVSLWLKENTKPGEIIFHTSWDMFPMLFFWNQQNYYINGMDPIFEYAFSRELYWKNHFIAIGGKPYTCASLPCEEKNSESLREVISQDFNASYAIVELDRNAGLNRNLQTDPGFEKIFTTANEVIYRVK
ncbi:MAG: hypothetical protein HYT03_00885 [Candidatus Harrisonbacteria bacterium]|nr:hypothetical protein [Candidatus Harrisonbacteria bacterium]